jgi:Fe-S cluster biosynthesis and repair protein YggX
VECYRDSDGAVTARTILSDWLLRAYHKGYRCLGVAERCGIFGQSIDWPREPLAARLAFPVRLQYVGHGYKKREAFMADDKCGDTRSTAPAPVPAGKQVRMVKCVKFGREMPGLDRIPWKGELGKRIYENVSQEAWKMWIEHSKMVMNEYRLNPLDPNSQKIMEDQLEQFFFGEGYVPPKSKG